MLNSNAFTTIPNTPASQDGSGQTLDQDGLRRASERLSPPGDRSPQEPGGALIRISEDGAVYKDMDLYELALLEYHRKLASCATVSMWIMDTILPSTLSLIPAHLAHRQLVMKIKALMGLKAPSP